MQKKVGTMGTSVVQLVGCCPPWNLERKIDLQSMWLIFLGKPCTKLSDGALVK